MPVRSSGLTPPTAVASCPTMPRKEVGIETISNEGAPCHAPPTADRRRIAPLCHPSPTTNLGIFCRGLDGRPVDGSRPARPAMGLAHTLP